MKATILVTSLVTLCALSSVSASAHNSDPLRPRKHYARMLTKKQLAPVRTSTTSVVAARPTGSGSGTVPIPAVPTPKGAFPIYPTGPGFDVPPLNRITAVLEGKPAPTVPLPTSQVPPTSTPVAGAPPTSTPVAGAPPIPAGILDGSKYPPLDKIPDVNSPEVKEWLKELEGANIPGFAPTKSTICDENPQAAAAAGPGGRCWRTCGGCMRDTDITTCKDKLHQGLTFDDGPSPYTPKLLTYLNSVDVKATFYLVGSRVISRPEMVQYQYQTGHELAVHTWSHPALTTLTTEQIVAELGWTRKAIKDATGVTPLTMRPPFGDIDDRVRAISLAMGMIPVIWTGVGVENEFDSNDWRVPAGQVKANDTVATFRNVYKTVPKLTTGFITLEHDLYQEAVDLAVGFHIPNALAVTPSLTLEPVNTCQNRPMTNAYLESNKDPQHPAILAGPGRVRVAPTPSPSAAPVKTGTGAVPSPSQTAAASGMAPSVLLALICGMITTVAGL